MTVAQIPPPRAPAPLIQTNLHFRRLTPLEAVAYLVGTNVGAAVLALPFAARHAGYAGVIVACLLATLFSLISHLFLVEAMLRTPAVTQLVGLFRTYLFRGRFGSLYLWFLFFITIGVAIPTLTAYVLGGAEALAALLGISPAQAQIAFMVLGGAAVWLGLKATGLLQKLAGSGMGLVLLLLIFVSLGHRNADPARLAVPLKLGALWLVLPVAVFTCLSMNIVPEIVRGLAHRPAAIPKVIRCSLLINLAFCLGLTLAIFILLPPGKLSEVATVGWGRALGPLGSAAANLFAFFALLTSFWGTAGSILTNVVDVLRFPSEWRLGYRLAAFAITILPSVIILIGRFFSFVQLVMMAGAVGGVLLALLPIPVLHRARKIGERQPEYIAPAWLGWPVQIAMVLFYLGVLIYAGVG